MALQLIQDGNRPTGTEWMNNYNESLNISGKNLIRLLQLGTPTFEVTTGDWFGDTFIDVNGRLNNVNTTNTTCGYSVSTSTYAATRSYYGTINDPDSYTNAANAFDGDDTTLATKTSAGGTTDTYLGKTFSATTVTSVYYNFTLRTGGTTQTTYLQTYNGSTWSDVSTLGSNTGANTNYTGYYALNSSVQGIRLRTRNTNSGNAIDVYVLAYGISGGESIELTVPSGTFSSSISKAIGVPLFTNWESTVDLQYKLQNASEDSGWLSCGITPSISSFTAFTSQPTKVVVKLIPKTNGLPLYPSIKGFMVRAT